MYPSSPILSQPYDVPEDIICTLEKPSARCKQFDNDFCECLGIINLPYNKNIDLYLIDEGKLLILLLLFKGIETQLFFNFGFLRKNWKFKSNRTRSRSHVQRIINEIVWKVDNLTRN